MRRLWLVGLLLLACSHPGHPVIPPPPEPAAEFRQVLRRWHEVCAYPDEPEEVASFCADVAILDRELGRHVVYFKQIEALRDE